MPSANVSICVRIGRDEIFPTFILSSNPNSDRRDHDEKNVQRAPWLELLLRRRISHELHPIADLIRLEISPVSSEKSSGVSAEYCRSKPVHLLAFPWADSDCDISRSIGRSTEINDLFVFNLHREYIGSCMLSMRNRGRQHVHPVLNTLEMKV